MKNLFTLLAALLLAGRALAQPAAMTPPTFTWGTTYTSLGLAQAGTPQPAGHPAATVAASGESWLAVPDSAESWLYNGLGRLRLERRRADGTLTLRRFVTGRGHLRQLRAAPNGRVYVVGYYLQTLSFDAQHALSTTDGAAHDFLACLDAGGAVLYLRDLTAGSGHAYAGIQALVPAPADHLYLGLRPSAGNANTLVQELDAQGVVLRTITQTGNMSITGLDLDALGALFVTGTCARPNTTSFAGNPLTTGIGPSGYNQYLACYEPAGTLRWVKFVEDVTCAAPQVRHDGAGGVFWLTSLTAAATLGSFTMPGPATGSTQDFLLARLDGSGTVQWAHDVATTQQASAGMGQFFCLDTDAAGNIYLAGQTRGSIQWAPGVQTTASTQQQLLVQRWSPAGLVEWARAAPATQGSVTGGTLAVAPDGSVLVTGTTTGPMTLDALTLPTATRYHCFVARLTPAARPSATAAPAAAAWQLTPNPAADRCTLTPPPGLGLVQAELYDALGRHLASATAAAPSFDLSARPPGLYLLRACAASGATWTGRVLRP